MIYQVGCDISKETIDIYNIRTDTYFRIPNNQKGYRQFLDKLPDKENLHICMEATGNYYEDFADYLNMEGYRVSVVNPLKIQRYAKSKFSRTKTDKQDAKLIAQYCREHQPKADYKMPTERQYQIKRLISHIKQLNQQKVSLKNRIKSSKDIFVTAQLRQQLRDTDRYLQECNARLAELSGNEETDRIDSIPAIGRTTAAILAHYLTFHQFDNVNQFTAFAGLCPERYESGESVRKKDRLSSLGNRTIKTALYMPAVVAYRLGLFRALSDRLERKGKSKKLVIAAIMRKLACLAFTLWQKKEYYRCSMQTV